MSQIGQAQTGALKSIPKLTRINGDDNLKVVYRNMGNNHAYPFIWASTLTVSSGTSESLVASGIKWHGYDLASYATVTATPKGNLGTFYMDHDEVNNTIAFKCSSTATADTEVGLIFMLGDEMVVSGIYCRNDFGANQSLP